MVPKFSSILKVLVVVGTTLIYYYGMCDGFTSWRWAYTELSVSSRDRDTGDTSETLGHACLPEGVNSIITMYVRSVLFIVILYAGTLCRVYFTYILYTMNHVADEFLTKKVIDEGLGANIKSTLGQRLVFAAQTQ